MIKINTRTLATTALILTALVKSVLIRGKDVDVGITSAYRVITVKNCVITYLGHCNDCTGNIPSFS